MTVLFCLALTATVSGLLVVGWILPLRRLLVEVRTEAHSKRVELEKSAAFQRAIFEQAPDGIMVVDHRGRILEANERLAGLFGMRRDELCAMRVDDLVPDRFRAVHAAHRRSYEDNPETRPMSRGRDLLGRRHDGTEFPIAVALSPLGGGRDDLVIATVKDVSDTRHYAERIEAALREKNLLLGEIHHRVKNNLQIIHSLLDLQAARLADHVAQEALRDSQNRVQSMALIHQTLYQSKDFAEVDFQKFLETLISHLQASYRRPDVDVAAEGDEVRLVIGRAIPCGLIVNELVTNAFKHAFPAGRGGTVRVRVTLRLADEVEVSVTDDGIGLPDDFDLESVDSLGMQLVQLLGEQLHGQLKVDRHPTCFALTFPMHPDDAPAQADPRSSP